MSAIIVCSFFLEMTLEEKTQKIQLQSTLLQKNLQKIILTDPQNKNNALLKRLTVTAAEKTKSINTNTKWLSVLTDLATQLPAEITLTKLFMTSQQIELQGLSSNLSDIHLYNAKLKNTAAVKSVTLKQIHQITNTKIDFTIQALQ
ncbi:MAG: hypothetical protein A3C44_08330 [Gammaproteobacteria bacterium RIFCSPHIGHO2_02_FULL_39_13]|nr:MAG: hypothetical protein A3C44_08330 [Gammaproteobacteria bacterium RIFCSPHIGHO2_02_FULL_39_13]OGT49952.1 MAG: hypothetical protein A3E53_06225 [Gammaproteobacteria bacterium RIFCSPHIGHO2_12_FULL_39_24]